jgi:hypothetical protein
MEDTSKSRVQTWVERERAYRAEQDTVNRKVLVNLAGMLVLLIASIYIAAKLALNSQ